MSICRRNRISILGGDLREGADQSALAAIMNVNKFIGGMMDCLWADQSAMGTRNRVPRLIGNLQLSGHDFVHPHNRALQFTRKDREPKNRWVVCLVASLIVLLLAACASGNADSTQSTGTPGEAPVNGFGVAANHVHSLLAMPDHVLLLATHYGFFRSEDGGATWKETAGGNGQIMHGLMTYSLGYSPLDLQRLYVLTLPSATPHDTIGLYTSADQGRTWKLSITAASLTSTTIFVATPGNDTPDEVYIYVPNLGTQGLRVSRDDGRHFSAAGTLPFGSILGLLALPGEPGHLLAYGDNGMARSTDGGAHWQVIQGITRGVSDMTTSGPHAPIYASGDAGMMVSTDDGVTFKVVNSQASYAALAVSPSQPRVLYGKTGLTVFRSTDGGRTWQALPHISGNLAVLAVNPTNPSQVYLSLSYPTAVYQLNGSAWQSLTPPA